MAEIPGLINGVTIELAPSAIGQGVSHKLVAALKHVIKQDLVAGYKLDRVYISSAKDSHKAPSRHVAGNAIDISRINGKFMYSSYGNDKAVTAIIDALQHRFESYPQRRENFGPLFKKKLGNPYQVGGHNDHIHFSVN